MSYRYLADRMLAKLAAELRTEELKLDEKGSLLTVLNGVLFSFHYDERLEALFIQADGGDLRAAGPEALGQALEKTLKANFLWQGTAGGILGLDDEERLILAYRLDFPLARLDEDERGYDDTLLELLPYLAGAAEWAQDLAAGPGRIRRQSRRTGQAGY